MRILEKTGSNDNGKGGFDMISKKLFSAIIGAAILLNANAADGGDVKNGPIVITLDPAKTQSVTGASDIRHLKHLAAGVGWEFDPNEETTSRLKAIGMKRIRCINVDGVKGDFSADGAFVATEEPARLKAHLDTCRELGAQPFIIIGQYAPSVLRVKKDEVKTQMAILGQNPGYRAYWNGDWKKMRAYWKHIFQYVLIDNHFANACFEVGNEPDIDGQFPRVIGEVGKMGSRKLYDSYFELYQNVAIAAAEFEQEHPGVKVRTGGGAFASFTFGFGDFNWVVEFLKDCSAKKLKLDYVGFHYYGNLSSIHGEYPTPYPPFEKMVAIVREARDQYMPGIPLNITEWGASYYNMNNTPKSMVNADNVGAVWCADFLKTAMENKVDDTLYLVTTDLSWKQPKPKEGEAPKPGQVLSDNMWGWESLFVNPKVFGRPWPKATFHIFSMISKLADSRIEIKGLGDGVSGIASVDGEKYQVTLMLWNFKARIPENNVVTDEGPAVDVRIALADGSKFFGTTGKVKMQTWLVSKDTSNALNEFEKTGKLTSASELQMVKSADSDLPQVPELPFTLPPSSILFVEWAAN